MRRLNLGKIMASEYISKSWQIYKKNFLTFIAADLISMILSGIFLVLGIAIFLGLTLPKMDYNMIMSTADETVLSNYFLDLFKNSEFIKSAITGIAWFGVLTLISVLISLYFSIGKIGMVYESLRKRTRLGTMFKVSRKLGFRWILTSFLIFVCAIGFGIIFGIVTLGIGFFVDFVLLMIAIPIMALIGPAMVVDNTSPIESIKRAFKTGKRNYLDLVGLWLIYFLGTILVSFFGGLVSSVPVLGGLINFLARMFLTFVMSSMISISFVSYYVNNRKGKELE
jgi:hypothetical protein